MRISQQQDLLSEDQFSDEAVNHIKEIPDEEKLQKNSYDPDDGVTFEDLHKLRDLVNKKSEISQSDLSEEEEVKPENVADVKLSQKKK